MSSSGDDPADKLPSGDDPAANTVLTGTIGFLNAGGTLGTLLQGAIFGTLVSVFTGGVDLIQSIVGVPVAALGALSEATETTIDATITEPLGIVSTTAETSATEIGSQFGPFAFLVGIGVFLGGVWLIIQFLQEDETSNLLPIPVGLDLPFVGVDEEDDVE